MAIDMRHTNLKAEEAALLSGELKKPSWQSRNEGIHERVSFEDTIWGFDLAGGSYYRTPLRVTAVKANSRADKAGIRPGDKLKRINDIDTSTLTIQEAHQIILDSGVHLKIAVTAPEDEEDAYFCYEDPTLENGYDSDEERRRLEEKLRKMQVHARVSHYWSLQWPWVSKRRIIYRESNCFMVPSKYEDKNRSKFPTQPVLKTTEDVVLESLKSERELNYKKNTNTTLSTPVDNTVDNINNEENKILNAKEVTPNGNVVNSDNNVISNGVNNVSSSSKNITENQAQVYEDETNSTQEDLTEDLSHINEDSEIIDNSESISLDVSNIESEKVETISEHLDQNQHEESIEYIENGDNVNSSLNDDEIINEILEDGSLSKEEITVENIVSDGEDQINHSDER